MSYGWSGSTNFISMSNRVKEYSLLKLFGCFLIILLSEQTGISSTKQSPLVKARFGQWKMLYLYYKSKYHIYSGIFVPRIPCWNAVGKHYKYEKLLLTPSTCIRYERQHLKNSNSLCFASIGQFYFCIFLLKEKVGLFSVISMYPQWLECSKQCKIYWVELCEISFLCIKIIGYWQFYMA
jgi:hypothetical protein